MSDLSFIQMGSDIAPCTHEVEWVKVPSSTTTSYSDRGRRVRHTPAHWRGECLWCGEQTWSGTNPEEEKA